MGTSVFELIEFSVDRHLPDGRHVKGRYGVNVAKVREVIRLPKINPLASSTPGIEGVFELRSVPIPAVNLNHVLGDINAQVTPDQQVIVAEFSQKRAGFIVGTTHRIRRVEWSKVLPPTGSDSSCITGMILVEDNEFLFILDLEKILNDLDTSNRPSADTSTPVQATATVPAISNGLGVLVVDDSSLIRKNVCLELEKIGYKVHNAADGEEALAILDQFANSLDDTMRIDAVVTDVEMPKMDGLSLIKKIREHPIISQMPVLLHSSLSGTATIEAGRKVGANGYVVKNDIKDLTAKLKTMLDDIRLAG